MRQGTDKDSTSSSGLLEHSNFVCKPNYRSKMQGTNCVRSLRKHASGDRSSARHTTVSSETSSMHKFTQCDHSMNHNHGICLVDTNSSHYKIIAAQTSLGGELNSLIQVNEERTSNEDTDCLNAEIVSPSWLSAASSSSGFDASIGSSTCGFCKSRFHTSKELIDHCLNVHVYPKFQECDGCCDNLIRIVMQHVCRHGPVEPDQKFDSDRHSIVTDGETCQNFEDMKKDSSKTADFPLQVEKKRRVRPKIGLNEYKCWHCEALFPTLQRLREHRIEMHSHEKRYKCGVCEKAYKRPDGLEIHMRNHTGERPYACPECSKAFSMSSSLKAHLITHLSGKMFLCKDCGRSLASAHTLRLHARLHTGERPFKCPLCDKTFARSDAMKSHLRTHRSDCRQLSVTKNVEKLLSPSASNTEKGRKSEEHNDKTDSRQTEPALDLSHVFTKRFMCSECGKQFFSHSMLVRHLRTHTGEKPFKCTECSASFADQGNLKRHRRLHTGEKPYKCDECSRQFSMPHSLKVHKISHKRKKNLEN